MRFSDVQLGDLGGCYPIDSKWATSGTMVGAPIWNSPEVLMELPWNTATDIWSFGTIVRNIRIVTTDRVETNNQTAHKSYLRRGLQHLPTERHEARR